MATPLSWRRRRTLHQSPLSFLSCIHHYRLMIKERSSFHSLKEHESSLSPQTLPKLRLRFQTSGMWSIVVKKSTGILTRFGSGKKDGEVKLWRNKELVELEEQLTVTATDFILQHSMQILWKIIQLHKSWNSLLIRRFCNLRVSASKTFIASHSQRNHKY